VPCTPAARTAIDLARTLDKDMALATLDCVLHNGVCGLAALAAELHLHRGLPGYPQARMLLTKADGRAQCTQESQLRLVIHTAGLVDFVPQVEVCEGGTRYVLDLADPASMVAAEYDGVSHDQPHRRDEDRSRHNWLDGHGWRMRYFTSTDLYRRPWKIIKDLRDAIATQR
jgi:very-short-patch-repair endonuclease